MPCRRASTQLAVFSLNINRGTEILPRKVYNHKQQLRAMHLVMRERFAFMCNISNSNIQQHRSFSTSFLLRTNNLMRALRRPGCFYGAWSFWHLQVISLHHIYDLWSLQSSFIRRTRYEHVYFCPFPLLLLKISTARPDRTLHERNTALGCHRASSTAQQYNHPCTTHQSTRVRTDQSATTQASRNGSGELADMYVVVNFQDRVDETSLIPRACKTR